MQHVKIATAVPRPNLVQRAKSLLTRTFKLLINGKPCSSCHGRIGSTDGCDECSDFNELMMIK